jgi:hypothetical protein
MGNKNMIRNYHCNQPLNVPGGVDAASFAALQEIMYAVVLGFW